MQLGPEQVLVAAYVRFRRKLSVQEIESAIARIEDGIRKAEPTIARIFIEADSLKASSSNK
jgi:hypothetical protein